jgi:hypothetical protein
LTCSVSISMKLTDAMEHRPAIAPIVAQGHKALVVLTDSVINVVAAEHR